MLLASIGSHEAVGKSRGATSRRGIQSIPIENSSAFSVARKYATNERFAIDTALQIRAASLPKKNHLCEAREPSAIEPATSRASGVMK